MAKPRLWGAGSIDGSTLYISGTALLVGISDHSRREGRLPQGCLNDILAAGATKELGVQPGKESGDRGPARLQPRRRLIPPNGAPKRSWRIRKAPRASAPGPPSPRGGAKVLWTA